MICNWRVHNVLGDTKGKDPFVTKNEQHEQSNFIVAGLSLLSVSENPPIIQKLRPTSKLSAIPTFRST